MMGGGGGGGGNKNHRHGGGQHNGPVTLWHKVAPPLLDQHAGDDDGAMVAVPSPATRRTNNTSSGIDVRRNYRSNKSGERRETIDNNYVDVLADLRYDPYNNKNVAPHQKIRYHKSQNHRTSSPFDPPTTILATGGKLVVGKHHKNLAVTRHSPSPLTSSQSTSEFSHEEEEPRAIPKKHQQQSTKATTTAKTTTRKASATKTLKRRKSNKTRTRGLEDSSHTEDTVRGCVRGTFTLGRQVTQCLLTTADLYQQECQPHQQRGDDSMFLVFDNNSSKPSVAGKKRNNVDDRLNPLSFDTTEDNSMTVSHHDCDDDSDDDDDDDDTPSTRGDDDEVTSPPAIVNISRQVTICGENEVEEQQQQEDEQDPSRIVPTEPAAANGMLNAIPFDHAITACSDIVLHSGNNLLLAAAAAIAPDDELRVGVEEEERGDGQGGGGGGVRGGPPRLEFLQGQAGALMNPTTAAPGNSNNDNGTTEDLRELRLDMFRQDLDMGTGRVVPQTKYKRAVQQLYNQAQYLEQVRRELETAHDALSKTQHDLTACKQEAVNRHQANAMSSEKLFRDRIQIEERLRNELKQKQVLQSEKALLEKELSLLKHSLKNAKLQAAKQQTAARSGSLSPPPFARRQAETPAKNDADATQASAVGKPPDTIGKQEGVPPLNAKQEEASSNSTIVPRMNQTANTSTGASLLTTKSPKMSDQASPGAEEKEFVEVSLGATASSPATPLTPDTKEEEPAVASAEVCDDIKNSTNCNSTDNQEEELVNEEPSKSDEDSSSSSGTGEEKENRQDSEDKEEDSSVSTASSTMSKLAAANPSLSTTTLVISLRTDLAMIKARLAEAKAARLSLEQSKADAENQARTNSAAYSKQVSHLRQQVLSLQAISYQESEKQEREKLELVSQVEQLTQKLQESQRTVHSQSESNEKLKAELTKAGEEVTKLREQVNEFYQQQQQKVIEKQQEQQVASTETKQLKQNLRDLQAELAKTNAEIVAQASEHLRERQRLQHELMLARQQQKQQRSPEKEEEEELSSRIAAARGSICDADPQPDDEEEEEAAAEAAAEDEDNNTKKSGMAFLKGVLSGDV